MKRDEPRDPNSPTSLSSLCSSLTLKQLYLVQSLFSHLQQPFDTQVKWLTDCYPICYMWWCIMTVHMHCMATISSLALSSNRSWLWWYRGSGGLVRTWDHPPGVMGSSITLSCVVVASQHTCNIHMLQYVTYSPVMFYNYKYNQWRVIPVNFCNSVTLISVTNPSLLICLMWFNLVENWFHPLPRCFSSEQWVTMAI